MPHIYFTKSLRPQSRVDSIFPHLKDEETDTQTQYQTNLPIFVRLAVDPGNLIESLLSLPFCYTASICPIAYLIRKKQVTLLYHRDEQALIVS